MRKLIALVMICCPLGLLAKDKVKTSSKKFECPAKLNVKKTNVGPWEIFEANGKYAPGEHQNSLVYYGHPKGLGALIPDIDNSPPKPSTWILDSEPGKYWLACFYKGTKAIYTLNLPQEFLKCTSFHSKKSGGFMCKRSVTE